MTNRIASIHLLENQEKMYFEDQMRDIRLDQASRMGHINNQNLQQKFGLMADDRQDQLQFKRDQG